LISRPSEQWEAPCREIVIGLFHQMGEFDLIVAECQDRFKQFASFPGMKHFLVLCLFILGVVCSAHAAVEGPLWSYFPVADTIYDVRVVSTVKDKITFSVVEVLRGKKVVTLVLTDEGFYDFKKDDEWMLLSCKSWRDGDDGNEVGSFFYGNLGWICAPMYRADGKAYVAGQLYDLEKHTTVFDKKFGDFGCLTLVHFKGMLVGKPFVSWYIGSISNIKSAADYGSDIVIASFAPANTWKPEEREPYCRFVDMQVINTLKGSFSGKISIIYQISSDQTDPEPGIQYVAFLAKWGDGYRVFKMLPATKENIDATKAAIVSK
jgi:hypothetical protein